MANKVDCPTCKGKGYVYETGTDNEQHKIDCFTCGGSGEVDEVE
jgi:DnaJ-class molecular chaperone